MSGSGRTGGEGLCSTFKKTILPTQVDDAGNRYARRRPLRPAVPDPSPAVPDPSMRVRQHKEA